MTPERIARLRQVLDKRQPDLTIITNFMHKQRNTSAIVRNADAVGIMRVHAVVGAQQYQEFRGTAMGSQRWVDVVPHQCLEDAVSEVRASSMQIVAAHPTEPATDFRALDYTRPTALLLGTERAGLDAEALAMADHYVSVPMVGMVGSYNVSVAAGIILAEAQRQRQDAGLYDQCRLDQATWQRLFFEWGHPRVRDFCQQRGLAYPALDEEGEISNPPAWYAEVRDMLAQLPESDAP